MRRFALLLVLSSAACIHTMSTEMGRWMGKDQATIVSRWGAPNLTADLPGGGKVLTWLTTRNSADADHQPEMTQCKQSFTLSPAGVAVSYAFSGCQPLVRGR